MIAKTLIATTVILAAIAVALHSVPAAHAEGTAMETAKEAPAQPDKPVKKTDEEWKKELTPEQYYILRQSGTERANGQVYQEFKKQGAGTYFCAGCDAELFSSKTKFDARCGWPSFYDPSKAKNVKTVKDVSLGMVRVEVRCAVCDGHLGHVFEGEGFNTPTDQRYCINGIALKFVPDKEEKESDEGEEEPAGDEKDEDS